MVRLHAMVIKTVNDREGVQSDPYWSITNTIPGLGIYRPVPSHTLRGPPSMEAHSDTETRGSHRDSNPGLTNRSQES